MKYQFYLRDRPSVNFSDEDSENMYQEHNNNMEVNYKQHDSKKKMKRYRSAFTTNQVNYLEEQYKKCSYITNDQRKEIATKLNITERAIKIWFQNRRMKEKREGGGQNFENEQNKLQEYTKYGKRLFNNNVIELPVNSKIYSKTRSPTSTKGIDFDKNYTTNNSINTAGHINKFNVLATTPVASKTIISGKKEHTSKSTISDVSSTDLKTSSDQQIDLCNKSKTAKLSPKTDNDKLQSQKEQITNESQKELKRHESVNITQQPKQEDLTLNTKSNEPVSEATSDKSGPVPTAPPLNPDAYFSIVLNPTGGSIVTAPDASVAAPSTSLANTASTSQDNVVINKCWHCDPNLRQLMAQISYTFPQQNSNYQYIITAVPMETPSSKLP